MLLAEETRRAHEDQRERDRRFEKERRAADRRHQEKRDTDLRDFQRSENARNRRQLGFNVALGASLAVIVSLIGQWLAPKPAPVVIQAPDEPRAAPQP